MSLCRNTCSRPIYSLHPFFHEESDFAALINVLQHLDHFGSGLKATIHLINLNHFKECRCVRIHVQDVYIHCTTFLHEESDFVALISVLQHLVHLGSKLKATIHLINLNHSEECPCVGMHAQDVYIHCTPFFHEESDFAALNCVLQHLVHFCSKCRATIHLIN